MKASKIDFDEIVKSFGGKVITINSDTTSLINPLDINLMNQKETLSEDAINKTIALFEAYVGDKLTQQEENAIRKIISENNNPERNVEDVFGELIKQEQNGVTGLSRLITIYEDMVNKKKKFKNG
ncbi:hypothetical protein [Bacillus pseudomycoides]|uniref:hypothetical protein n=1 Tax=Bacillus pseudomycoides TaxID=64104 RepID=UPI000BF1CBEA|nr:hypothetical protein [Bacillus pseudomycoides]PEM69356.1 hypothetical protein CN619_21725 [Bacillus pseudomycoides]PGA62172.1 hypothetical protein COL84_13430 [Bacillus pseudomycoides]